MKYYGKYHGFVRQNVDPENRTRVRCYCPAVMGPVDSDEAWLDWAEPCFPWLGGMNLGDSGPPFTREEQIEAFGREYVGLWIEFRGGDENFPIWSGTFNIAETPTTEGANQLGTDGGDGLVGGGILGADLPGSLMDDLTPPRAKKGREVRLRAPKGVDIVLGVEGGGYLVLGASGAHLTGVQLTLNGHPFFASYSSVKP